MAGTPIYNRNFYKKLYNFLYTLMNNTDTDKNIKVTFN